MSIPARTVLSTREFENVNQSRLPRQRRGGMGNRPVVIVTSHARVPLPVFQETRQVPGTDNLIVTRPNPRVMAPDLRQIPGTEYILKS